MDSSCTNKILHGYELIKQHSVAFDCFHCALLCVIDGFLFHGSNQLGRVNRWEKFIKFIKGAKGIFPSINLKRTERFKHRPKRCKLQHLICLLNRSLKRIKQGILMEKVRAFV